MVVAYIYIFPLHFRFMINLLFYTWASGLPSIHFHVSRSLDIIFHASGLVPPSRHYPPPPPPKQWETNTPKIRYEINSHCHTQIFRGTAYNFIHNCILNYIHTETNLSPDQLVVSKYSALITTCLLHVKCEEFRFRRCPFHITEYLSFHKSTIKSQLIFFGQYVKITDNQQFKKKYL
jgi:hypothetical protein